MVLRTEKVKSLLHKELKEEEKHFGHDIHQETHLHEHEDGEHHPTWSRLRRRERLSRPADRSGGSWLLIALHAPSDGRMAPTEHRFRGSRHC